MRRVMFFGVFSLWLVYAAMGQNFVEVNAGLENMGRSDVAWGDYDGDHDLDLVISGMVGYEGSNDFKTLIYRNDAGVFVDIEAGLPGVANSSSQWGDVDGDGDLDLILIGGGPAHVLYLFRNDGGVFSEMETNLPNYGKDGVVSWEDYDHDGDLDLLLAAYYVADVFRNDGDGVFTPLEAGFPAMISCMGDWGDYDGDGDADIILCGNDGVGGFCDVFRNDDGVFVALNELFSGLFAGGVEWVDIDGDGDLDIFMSGYNDALTPFSKLYLNEWGLFYEIQAGTTSMALGVVTFGDMDNDGDQDLFMSGNVAGCGNLGAVIYENEGGIFNVHNAPIPGLVRSDGAWGDFDNDGDLDLVVTGFKGTGEAYTRLFRNEYGPNEYMVNTPPVPSAGTYESFVDGRVVTLQWPPFSDDHSPQESILYNVYVGTAPGKGDVVTPNALIPSGDRMVARGGNGILSHSFVLSQLAPGTYYWGVQGIDQSFAGGAFSDEVSFTITETGNEAFSDDIMVYPNPANEVLYIQTQFPCAVSLLDVMGRTMVRSMHKKEDHVLFLEGLAPGFYTLRMEKEGVLSHKMVIKQ
ncbi:MAG: hypothetical protein CSA95_03310 [Bacteroidetes bacterium]|nr:MAG: hypothetical protein CSA95_03310 [Bacteroidota bacterium]PIE88399.1 MAG: hypothetical protein CSA04_02105 [Bacteroidota bacterium]